MKAIKRRSSRFKNSNTCGTPAAVLSGLITFVVLAGKETFDEEPHHPRNKEQPCIHQGNHRTNQPAKRSRRNDKECNSRPCETVTKNVDGFHEARSGNGRRKKLSSSWTFVLVQNRHRGQAYGVSDRTPSRARASERFGRKPSVRPPRIRRAYSASNLGAVLENKLDFPLLIVPVVLFYGGTLPFLNLFNYSVGERTGVLSKISRKGVACWTTEGELAQPSFSKSSALRSGGAPIDNTFYFSVPNPNVRDQLAAVPPGASVSLQYEQKLFALDLPLPAPLPAPDAG